ncbi:unnamed protein product [Sphagnum balticum]
MLCICVGTDIYPAIALAYEEPELDIMTRKPRREEEHLVSGRMLVHSYGLMGSIATASGFFTYFLIMELYGFPPSTLFFLLAKPGLVPMAMEPSGFPDWLSALNTRYDLRGAYNTCCPPPNEARYCSLFDWPQDAIDTISPVTGSPVKFTTEVLAYAQSGYFCSVVIVQWSNIFACKSRKVAVL